MLFVKRQSALMVFGAYVLYRMTQDKQDRLAWIESLVSAVYANNRNAYIIKWFLYPRRELGGRCVLDVLGNDTWELGDGLTKTIERLAHFSNDDPQ